LHLLRVRKLAVGSLIIAVSGLRFFYGQVLHRPTQAIEQALPRMKKPLLRPRVYSVQELERLFAYPELSRKHRAIFMATYAAGLRVSEVTHLRIGDLSSERQQIRVVQGKGRKDRYTLLSPRLLVELRSYWRL
jgi:site-specific recombinase XerD